MPDSAPVVLCTDLSASAERARDAAFAVARAMNRPLRIVHVLNPSPWNVSVMAGIDSESVVERLREAAVSALDELVAMAVDGGVRASSEVCTGMPSQVIPERVQALESPLLVMGRRGESNLRHVLLGSTADRVLRQSPCSVLVVPRSSPDPLVPERILVGTDFSRASAEALARTARFARELNCRGIVVAHVNPPDDYKLGWSELAYEANHPTETSTLRNWLDEQGNLRLPVEALLVRGETERALFETANREGCAWIAVGGDMRGMLASMLLSGLTQRLLMHAERPVLVVRTSDEGVSASAGGSN